MPAIAAAAASIRRRRVELSADERCAAGRGISQAHRRAAPDRPALLHRQIAQQLDVRALHPVRAAQREDHRRAAPSALLLLLEFSSAFRAWSGLQLRPDGPRPILFGLCSPHGAHGRSAAGQGSPRHLRADGRRHRERSAAAARLLRPRIRTAVLEFYKTERAVRTPSSEQVRRPIYREATEEWRAYEAHLAPLKAALGPCSNAYPDAPASFPQR